MAPAGCCCFEASFVAREFKSCPCPHLELEELHKLGQLVLQGEAGKESILLISRITPSAPCAATGCLALAPLGGPLLLAAGQ